MATNKQVLESRLQQMDKDIDSIENHILKAQVYLNNLKDNYVNARSAWFAIRDNLDD